MRKITAGIQNAIRDRINAVRGALGLPLVSLTQFHGAGALRTWFN